MSKRKLPGSSHGHYEEGAGPSSFNCQICQLQFRSEEELGTHTSQVHPHLQSSHQCHFCVYNTGNYNGK